ncbi:MAG: Nif3-like dinuclear metal center hexameric protein [Gemmatimonadaceae bacterium]
MTHLADIARHLDLRLAHAGIPDYDRALNGLQLSNTGDVHQVAAAVDFSLSTVRHAIAARATLLVVHHGMFWNEPQPIVAARYERLHLAITHDLAVYSSHLPLDHHPELGNNVLLARRLGLVPDSGFGRFRGIDIGVAGSADLATAELLHRTRVFAEPLGSCVIASPFAPERHTQRWGVLTGAGASSDTLREAQEQGIDTLVVGEGPHHTGVDAEERGLVVIYAGHYATETLGVQAIAAELEQVFALPWSFVHTPTGL